MKMQLSWIALLGVLGTLLLAQQPEQPQDNADRLIKDLDDKAFETRRRAHAELLKVGKPAIPRLKRALADNPSLEVAVRLKQILRKVMVRADAGPPSGDLQVRLTADQKGIKPGATVKFTVTIFNLADEDLNLQTGYSYCGNYIKCGYAFRRIADGKQELGEIEPRCLVGFCGTGAYPLIETVLAEGALEYSVTAAFGKSARDLAVQRRLEEAKAKVVEPAPREVYAFGNNQWFVLDGPAEDGTHRLYVTLTSTVNGVGRLHSDAARPRNAKAAYWCGTIQSNEVQIRVHTP
jgi:hypothetical protein